MNCTMRVVKTKGLISCAVTAQLICTLFSPRQKSGFHTSWLILSFMLPFIDELFILFLIFLCLNRAFNIYLCCLLVNYFNRSIEKKLNILLFSFIQVLVELVSVPCRI